VAFGYLPDDGQPEAGAGHAAGRRGPVEAVEHVRQVAGGNPGSVVSYGQLAGPQAHLHRGARPAELGRVVQEVADGDLQPVGVAGYHARLEIRGEGGLRPVPAGAVQRGRDHLGEVHLTRRAVQRLSLGQFGDVGNQLAELGDLGHDPLEHLLALFLRQAGLGGQQFGVDAQAGQRSAEFVAGVADQLPLGGQRPLQRRQHGVE